MDKFNLNIDAVSFYVAPPVLKNHSLSTSNIEQEDTSKLIEALLSEFDHSSDEEKAKYKPLLEEWLSNMNDDILFNKDEQKVRDLIYEMF